jgi:hypothetical protein
VCAGTRVRWKKPERAVQASQRVENEKNRRTHSGSSAGSTLALQGRSSTPPSGPLASPATSASPCPSAGCRRRSSSAWRSSPPAVPLLYLTGPQSFSPADPVGHRLPRRQQSHLRLLAFRTSGAIGLPSRDRRHHASLLAFGGWQRCGSASSLPRYLRGAGPPAGFRPRVHVLMN